MKQTRVLLRVITIGLVIVVIFLVNRQHRLLTPTAEQLQDAFPGKTRQTLEQSSQFTLLSLEPRPEAMTKEQRVASFHGYKVLGQIQITDLNQKQELLRALYDGIARSQVLEACFSPRHGIHAVTGNKSVDLLICFHCQQFEIYWGKSDKLSGVTNAPQATFDRLLSDAGIPLAEK